MSARPAALLLAALLAAALAGCGERRAGGEDAGAAERSERLVDYALEPPWITALEVDPADGSLLLGTNKGFWRIHPASGELTRIRGRIEAEGRTDTVGTFLEVEPIAADHWLGSGHPDSANTLPQYLGLIESRDRGRTWSVISRLGEADLHKIFEAHGRLYAFDAVLGAILISQDGGETFEERFTPRGLVNDFVVDPDDPDYLLAATDEELYRTEDGGRRWRPVLAGSGIRLAWPEPGRIVRGDADGTIRESTDRGATFSPIGRIDGEVHRFETTDDPQHLYAASAEGAIFETRDGGRTWEAVFRP